MKKNLNKISAKNRLVSKESIEALNLVKKSKINLRKRIELEKLLAKTAHIGEYLKRKKLSVGNQNNKSKGVRK
ncbi:MAG: hypothetical protein PHX27_00360 [Candidatus ainarchaeum sp.]|nr:hypothetical protein [Candidatus ainarchaeum sp.]